MALEQGDLEDGLGAAAAVGDDTIQRRTQGRVVPDAFTHGTAEQRMRWFRRGYETGDPGRCDTFSARTQQAGGANMPASWPGLSGPAMRNGSTEKGATVRPRPHPGHQCSWVARTSRAMTNEE